MYAFIGQMFGWVMSGIVSVLAAVVLMAGISQPPGLGFGSLQANQRDTARKNDISILATQVISFQAKTRGSFPTADQLLTDELEVVQAVDNKGEPTLDTALYVTGKNCSDEVASRYYSITIKLEGGGTYCSD